MRSLLRIKRLSDELRGNVQVIRTQRDALLAAQRQKDELTALIVHDLKNPLSSILSNVQYVQSRAALPVDERESLEDVLRASQAMVRLVMNLLDVSRSDDGALIPHVSAFELPELLGEICSEMGRRIEDKGQRLELSLAPGVGILCGDRDLVRRIVENLIDNAYKYGPKRATISVEVLRTTMADGAEPAVEIRVRDEGEGIPAAYRQLVFEKYGRAGGSGMREARSSHGLGLVFCRRAATVHGGAVWIDEQTAPGELLLRSPSSRPPSAERDGRPAGVRRTKRARLPVSVKLEDETPGTRRLYAEYQQEIWEHTDRMFLWLLVAQWLGGSPPRSWPPPRRAPEHCRTCRWPGRPSFWGERSRRCRSTWPSAIPARRSPGGRSRSVRGCSPRC